MSQTTQVVVNELIAERTRIDAAILALTGGKRRGRPPKNGAPAVSATGKRRGRPPGRGKKKRGGPKK